VVKMKVIKVEVPDWVDEEEVKRTKYFYRETRFYGLCWCLE